MSPSTAHSILNRDVRLETKVPSYFMFSIDSDADPAAGGRDIAEIYLDMGAAGCSKMPRCKAPEILRSKAYSGTNHVRPRRPTSNSSSHGRTGGQPGA